MKSRSALAGFIIGTNDLAKEMRCRLDGPRTALRPALTMTVMAARAHGLTILDGVYNDLSDDVGLNAQCEQGVTLGFDGKTLIHPRQIEAAHRAFSPSESEIRRARAIVAAFDDPANAGKGVLTVEGGMVEVLHLQIARQVLAVAARINMKVDG